MNSDTSIQMDEDFDTELTSEEVANKLFEDIEDDQDDLSEDKETEEEESDDEESEDDSEESDDDSDDDESDDDDEDESEDKPADKAKLADDDAEVEVTVDGTTTKLKVKDLKRLAGQEAALTRKSQEVAEVRKAIDVQGQAAAVLLDRQYAKAQEKAAKYKDIDMFAAARELDADDFEALKAEKEAAEADVRFIEEEIGTFLAKTREATEKQIRQAARTAVAKLKEDIPEWNDDLYNDIRKYAIEKGMQAEAVNQIVDPTAIMMLHKARLYDLSQQKSEATKAKIKEAAKKVKPKSKSIVRGAEREDRSGKDFSKLRRRAETSGSIDDVVNLITAGME